MRDAPDAAHCEGFQPRAILRTDVKTVRSLTCIVAVLLVGCATSANQAVDLAKRLDWTTSYAHALLRAGFDQTAVSEDDIDRALMREVRALNEADRTLPVKVEEFERDRANGHHNPEARQAILNALDVIGSRYAAIVRTVQARQTHQAVHKALSETPELVAELRERVTSSVD